MNRRNFVKTAALVPLVAGRGGLGWASSTPAGGKAALPTRETGLNARYQLTLRRVLHGQSPAYTEDFVLADARPEAVRRFTEYSGDVSGRYIGALATAARVYGTPFPHLDVLVAKTVALQKPDGYFGSGFHYDKPADLDLALLWGNGRLLVGLLEYYRLKPDPQVLACCKRLGNWLVRIGPLMLSDEIRAAFGAQHFASSYICWMQQTEGLANLYAVTKDDRYRSLAAQIAAVIELRPGDHVHGCLTSLRGVMDLYAATGDAKLVSQCETEWERVATGKDALLTGGVPEGWSPNGHRTEGCAEADWVRLSLALWHATGKQKYLEVAERAIFNELAFNQFATGDFGHRVYTDTGLAGDGSARAWWCCTLHGLRAFPDIHASVFRATKDGLWYDLPLDGHATHGQADAGGPSAVAESRLAQDGTVRIRITAAGPGSAALRVRKPAWAQRVEMRVNGSAQMSKPEDEYATLERVWSAGDVVEVKYSMGLRTVEQSGDRQAYFYGPWLLGAPWTDNPVYFNELTTDNRLKRGQEASLAAAPQPERPFTVPIAATMVPFVPAEYPDQPQKVALRAIAEQTGMSTTAWELRFLGAKQT